MHADNSKKQDQLIVNLKILYGLLDYYDAEIMNEEVSIRQAH